MNELHYQRKVTCPTLPAAHLHRESLVSRVNDILNRSVAGTRIEAHLSPYKLVLLYAPAGYGKTTLLTDFAQHTSLPCCWYFLDHTDIDCITFLTVLLVSIRQQFPNFGRALDSLLTGSASEHANHPTNLNYFETVVDTLITTIEAEIPQRFALLLCNYQEINELPAMNTLVSYFLQKLPRQYILVIESRVIPNLDFAQLLAGPMIFGIGLDQLRFTAQQIHQLAQIQGVGPFTDAEAQQLSLTFDGWIAGILLGTRLGNVQQFQQSQLAPLFADAFERQAASQYLFSYVVNEVFKSHQPAYTFLREACVLQEMSPALCAALLDMSSSEAHSHLHYLEQQNLFVTHSGEGSDIVYICTPVLCKLFYEELRRDAPERFSHLHQRAAELLSATHNYSQAIYHALEGSVNDIAAGLIIEAAESMMNQGHAEILARWIDAFPTSTTNCYPQLLTIRANIYLRQGYYHSALPLLDDADTAVRVLASQASPLDTQNLPALQAAIAIVRSKILFRQKEYQQSQLVCQKVLSHLPANEVTLKAEAHNRLGLCYIQLGDFIDGIAQIQKALQLWGRHTIQRQTADGHSVLARAYALLGNFALAEHHMTRALVCWDQLQDTSGKVDNLIRLGNIKVRQGVFPEAETIFQEALTLARGPTHYQRGQAYALDCLGIFYQRREHYERALVVTEEALALAQQIRDQNLLYDTLCDLAMIYLYMGDTATAMIVISEAKVQTANGNSIGYERALHDLIYGTIYLYQGQYHQAGPYLARSETTLSSIGLKQEHLLALLRLAVYYLAQDQFPAAVLRLEAAAAIVPICEGYAQLAQLEMRRLPGLVQALKTLPELAQARALFHLEAEYQTTPTHEDPPTAQGKEPLPQSISPPFSPEMKVLPHTLTILALGEPVVFLQQEPVTRWRMARAMELFYYLLDCSRPMRKEQIITALWPTVDEQTEHTLYSTIYYLRKALGDSCVVSRKGTYTLDLASRGDQIRYDVADFQAEHVKARQALAQDEPAAAKTALLTMVELYRGDYVEPFYSEWCYLRRDELRLAYLDARSQLAQLVWKSELFDESIHHWQHVLAIDACQEEAHYGLMRCYLRQGKRGLALRQYQRCRDTLQQELGVQPGPSLQRLYHRLTASPAH